MSAPLPTSSEIAHPPPPRLTHNHHAYQVEERQLKETRANNGNRSSLACPALQSVCPRTYTEHPAGSKRGTQPKVPKKEGNFGATATSEERLLWRSRNEAEFRTAASGLLAGDARTLPNYHQTSKKAAERKRVLNLPCLQISGEFRRHGAAHRHRIDASWRLRLVHPLQDPPGPLVGQEKVYRGTAIARQS
jgi:hypothetical protein